MGFNDSTVHFREWPMVEQRGKAVALQSVPTVHYRAITLPRLTFINILNTIYVLSK